MKDMLKIGWSLTFLFGIGIISFPQTSIPEIESTIDTNVIRIGEPIQLNVTVSYPTDLEISWPLFDQKVPEFDLISEGPAQKEKSENGFTELKTYEITSFDTGFAVIEPIKVAYINLSTKEGDTVETILYLIRIRTVSIDTSKNINPIKSPYTAKRTLADNLHYIMIPILVLLLLAIGYYLYKRSQKKDLKPRPDLAVPKVPGHETALKKLHVLYERELWQNGEIKSYHSELSEIVREYIESRYQTLALESTTDEIMDSFRKIPVRLELVSDLHSILEISDLAKFAKVKPDAEENERCWHLAKKFVLNTKIEINENGMREQWT